MMDAFAPSSHERRAVTPLEDIERFCLSPERSRFWFARVAICLEVLVTCGIATFSAYSLNRAAFVGVSGVFGWGCLIALAMVATLGILDVIINDLLPERWHMNWVRHERWMLFMAIAAIESVFGYAALNDAMLYGILFRFLLDTILSIGAAGLDLMERSEALDRRRHKVT